MVELNHLQLSIRRQCELLNLQRSTFYYQGQDRPSGIGELGELSHSCSVTFNYSLIKQIDQAYLKWPFYGSRRITAYLKSEGYGINRKRIQRLMRQMGIQAIYPRKKLSRANSEHRIFPYLLNNVTIERVNQVWSTDITYIPMRRGFLYLVAIMDWYSRYVLSWSLSQTLEKYFCLTTLEEALSSGKPEIFNSDQGSQFTCIAFTRILQDRGIAISMDGRGRVFDNIFIERLWRTVKQEEVYLKDYQGVFEAQEQLEQYFKFYNTERLHQSLGYRKPCSVYFGEKEK